MSERDFRLYCEDILDSGAAILEFVKGLSFEEFSADRKTYSAVIREFEIIGEAEFTAIIEPAPEGCCWAICPEVPGANGQGETVDEAKDNLRQAIELIFEDRNTDILRGLSEDAI